MNRRKLRTHTFEALFSAFYFENDDMPGQTDLYLDGLDEPLVQDEKDEIKNRVLIVVSYLEQIDEIISKNAVKWSVKRMSHVDLTILRLAVYEIMFDESIPNPVAINEAVELAKIYGGDSSASFVNGVLARVIK